MVLTTLEKSAPASVRIAMFFITCSVCSSVVRRDFRLGQTDLAGHVEGVASLDRLRVRTERRGALVGGDNLLAHGAHGKVPRDGRGGAAGGAELRGSAEKRGGDGGHCVDGVLDSDDDESDRTL